MSGKPHDLDRRELLKNALRAVDDMRARLEASERAAREPIAIVGMGCRLPGGASTPERFWTLLADGVDAVRDLPEGRWSYDAYAALGADVAEAMPKPRAGFLDDFDAFDAHFFGIAPREAQTMDPQHRMVLESSWEALEHAGLAPDRLKGSPTGVFIGITAVDYAMHMRSAAQRLDVYSGTGSAHNVAAGRLSYILGLHGPSMAVDTACSSSLTAIHLACQSLRLGESQLAIAGGVNTILVPDWFVAMSRWGMLAPDGRCKAFDAAADGMVRAEGCGIVVLKRLSDATADGSRILAVIRGSAVNQDGPSSGLTVPNGPAQEAVIRQALRAAGVAPAEVQYVETHGTGTTLGDPIELEALDAVFSEGRAGDAPLIVGSVKTNVGHLESASGVTGLLKVVLSLQHRAIPPHLHFRSLSPAITLRRLAVEIPTETLAWDAGGGRRRIAGVSSFGLSGTNAHVVLEEAPPASGPGHDARGIHVLTLSARTATALASQARRWREHLEAHPALEAGDVAHTANTGRAAFAHRAAIAGTSIADFTAQLAAVETGTGLREGTVGHVRPKDRPRVAFLFTGQGSQYAGMGRQLYRTQPLFRDALDRCDAALGGALGRPLLSVLDPAPGDEALIDQTAFTQPALFALEYALSELWAAWGIQPAAVLGHSVGEYVAACVAGVFSLEDGLTLIAARGRLMQALPAGGAMAAVLAGEDDVRDAIARVAPAASIAAINGPANVVVSGAGAHVRAVVEAMGARGVASRPLTVSHAFHSSLMAPMLPEFTRIARQVRYSAPRIPLVSNLTGRPFDEGEAPDADYWTRHVLEPVRFADGMRHLATAGPATFLEIGPSPTLSGMGRRCLEDGGGRFLASLRRERSDWHELLTSAAALFVAGAPIDWEACDRGLGFGTVDLPTYPFERERYWIAAEADAVPTGRHALPGGRPALGDPGGPRDLLGHRLRSPLKDLQFERSFSAGDPAFVADHVIHGRPVVPATAYVTMATAAAAELWGEGSHVLDDLAIVEPLTLDEHPVPVQTIVTPAGDGQASIQVLSQPADGEPWRLHVAATLVKAAGGRGADIEPLDRARARCVEPCAIEALYEWYRARGIEYGPRFACLTEAWRGDGEAVAAVRWPAELGVDPADWPMHPAVLDACFQTVAAALTGDHDNVTYVPVNIAQVVTFAGAGPLAWSHVRVRPGRDVEDLVADVTLFDPEGRPAAEVRGVRARPASGADFGARPADPVEWLHEVAWIPAPASGDSAPAGAGTWVILGAGATTAALARHADAAGSRALVVAAVDETDAGQGAWSRIDPASAESFDALCRAIADRGDVRGIVHAWALDRTAPSGAAAPGEHAVRRGCESLLLLAQALDRHRLTIPLTVVTRGAQAATPGADVDVAQAPLWGLGRAVRREHPELRCTCVDLDAGDPDGAVALWQVLTAPHRADQIAVRGGRAYVPRLTRVSGQASLTEGSTRALDIASKGVLDSLRVTTVPRRAPGPGEVEIDVEVAALNFRDVLNALGMYSGEAGPLGSECAGTVVAVGPGVEHLRVGDEVVSMAPGAFRRHTTMPADLVVVRPPALSAEAAVTVPIAFLTAEYGLTTLAGMRRGDHVLVHAGAGGVGLAAIQLAQRAGAEVFATAGSDEKRAHLRALGVPHVFNSRTLDFADAVLSATAGRGVDIVLNSLAGEFLAQSVRVLAAGGRFVEIGKGGIWTREQMAAARPDVQYFPLYLGDVPAATTSALLRDLLADVAGGRLTPLPHRSFALDRAVDAFRHMAQARHIGKVLLTCRRPAVRSDSAYLVTGAFGALGSAVARWLAARGARHLVLVGRSGASTTEAAALTRELESSGVRVEAVAADVADGSAMAGVWSRFAAGPQLRGIVHAAGVVEDALLPQQTWAQFERVLAPKARGAWLLHTLSEREPLDFFVMFSSAASLLPTPGQANYAAANAFLDGLAHHRRAQALPALSIGWGPWQDGGMAARLTERDRARWRKQGVGAITHDAGLAVLESLIAGDGTHVGVLPIEWRAFAASYGEGSRPVLLDGLTHRGERRATAPGAGLSVREQIDALPPSEARRALHDHVCAVVRRVLAVDAAFVLEPQQGLRDLGMDSLMAVELRNELQRSLGLSLPSTLAFDFPVLESLTGHLTALVGIVEDSESAQEAPATSARRAEIVNEVAQLSDQDAEALLAEELNR
jgi:acyl transferase domain-containing protein/NADPH:quinone reductase-like Zn-dependent oxidoreductase/acyl carrier protein